MLTSNCCRMTDEDVPALMLVVDGEMSSSREKKSRWRLVFPNDID